MSAPFSNDYNLRTVASTQAKSCMICYKPSVNVLITNNNVDFFYICYSHLNDETFASKCENEEYHKLVKRRKALEILIEELDKKLVENTPSMLSKIPGFTDKEKTQKQTEKYKEISTDKDKYSNEVKEVKQQIDDFKFKKFQLHNNVFKIRLRNYINKMVSQKKMKDMSEPGYFPSVSGLKEL